MNNKLSYELIVKATSGEPEAIESIVSIYEPYINTLASQTLYDEYGNKYIGVNVYIKEHLISKLLDMIYKYKIN